MEISADSGKLKLVETLFKASKYYNHFGYNVCFDRKIITGQSEYRLSTIITITISLTVSRRLVRLLNHVSIANVQQ